MNSYDDMLFDLIRQELSFPRIATELIRRKLNEQGIELSKRQLRRLRKRLGRDNFDDTKVKIPSRQVRKAGLDPNEFSEIFVLDLSDSDAEIEEIHSKFLQSFEDALPELTQESARIIFEALVKKSKQQIRIYEGDRRRFNRKHRKLWGKAISSLEIFLWIALELGETFSHNRDEAVEETSSLVVDVLVRLHARACLVSTEILTLLKAGLPDGAHARWRCLHEIVVVAFFIKEHGHSLAERYVLHDAIESFKAAELDREYAERLGTEPISDEEFREIKQTYDDLISRFGKSYGGTYGWAVDILSPKAASIKNIEESIGLDHLRPYYKLASHNIHPNPKGILFKLGQLQGANDFLLAGPSIYGLADPGHGTAISMVQITTALLTIVPTLDRMIECHVLRMFEEVIGEEFIEVHNALGQSEASA